MYLRDVSAQTVARPAALREKLQDDSALLPCQSALTPGQPVPALTLERQAPGSVFT